MIRKRLGIRGPAPLGWFVLSIRITEREGKRCRSFPRAPAGLEAEHVADGVAAGLLVGEPFGGTQRTMGERVAVCCDVGELKSLAECGIVRRMSPYFVPDAERMH